MAKLGGFRRRRVDRTWPSGGVEAGGDEGWHVEGVAQLLSSSPAEGAHGSSAGLPGSGRQAGEGGGFFGSDGSQFLSEEHVTREGRRITVALKTARLMPIKTLEGFDLSFQPSLDRDRVPALAQLHFIERAEVVHLLGPPGTGKSHLATALGIEAVRAGKRVYRATLAEIIEALSRAERDGRLPEKLRFFTGECQVKCVSL